MKETNITRAVEQVDALKLKAVDIVIEEVIDPLGQLGNPEQLMGKKYEDFTREDLMRLGQIYGREPNALSNLIFRREYGKILKMERDLGG